VVVALGIAAAVCPDAVRAEQEGSTTAAFASRFAEASFDVAVLRPLSTVALVAGSAFFVASVPLVAPFEGLGPSWNAFVYAPYEYVVLREIGDF
jgi:hypothetical protein